MSGERIADRLRTAARQRPSDRVAGRAQHQSKSRRGGRFEREKRMRRDSGEKSARPLLPETDVRQAPRRRERGEPKTRERDRMPRKVQHRLQEFRAQFFPVAHEWLHQSAPGTSVFA